MIKDIEFKKVKDIAIAVAPTSESGTEVWKVYLVNLKDRAIDSVLVHSEGYGTLEGKQVKTSSLRQFFEKIKGREYVVLEILPEKLKSLSNQFWISFWFDGFLYDKKYVFVTESIVEHNFTYIPVLEQKGVMIK